MSTVVPLTLDVPSAVAIGNALLVEQLGDKLVHITAGIAQVQLQTSVGDATGPWQDEGSPLGVTAAGVELLITKPCRFIRADVTGFTSGTLEGRVNAYKGPQGG